MSLPATSLVVICLIVFVSVSQESMPCLRLPDGRSVSGDLAIARYVARSSTSPAAAGLLGGADPVEASVVDQWLDLSQTHDLVGLASTLDAHLAPRYKCECFTAVLLGQRGLMTDGGR